MTYAAADPVPSGQQHSVLEVSDREPSSIDQFVGSNLRVLIARSGSTQVVTGDGARSGEDIRFYEKDESSGKDVRVWRIAGVPGGGFTAASV